MDTLTKLLAGFGGIFILTFVINMGRGNYHTGKGYAKLTTFDRILGYIFGISAVGGVTVLYLDMYQRSSGTTSHAVVVYFASGTALFTVLLLYSLATRDRSKS